MDYGYVWADGIHVNIRLEEAKLCLLVLVGVRADGRKELVALADGYRSPKGPGRTCCAQLRREGGRRLRFRRVRCLRGRGRCRFGRSGVEPTSMAVIH
jgi:hypothetical protein